MNQPLALAILLTGSPALAQSMDHSMDHSMHHSIHHPAAPTALGTQEQSMAGMKMPAAESHDGEPAGTDQASGSAEPPPIAHDRAADRYWAPADMAAAESAAMHPLAATYSKLIIDLAEYQFRAGEDGYRWEGEAWIGDLNRFVIKSTGEGTSGGDIDQAEVQALYSKALNPWWNLQLGVRQDIRPRPARTWAAFGIEGRAPYQFEVQAAIFLSDKGQLTARVEGAYDQRITQRLILQPRAELDLSAQDMPDQRIGAGLTSAELGLRLRYEIRREFAPYVGINWTWAAGRTGDYARADGTDTKERSVVAGIRFWF
jgi:copper resistance protein B